MASFQTLAFGLCHSMPIRAQRCSVSLCDTQLANGQIVEVPPALIKRQKQHFTTLEGTGELSLSQ